MKNAIITAVRARCDGGLVARTKDGELVATRGPFDECNLEDWIIETPGG